MESKYARLKIIQNWIDEGKKEITADFISTIRNRVVSQYQYVEKNATLQELGEQFLSMLKSYHNANFEGPDWKVEMAIRDRRTSLYIISKSNELSLMLHAEPVFRESELDARLFMTYEELRSLTNLETDLISIMIRNRGADEDRSARPMELIRPLSDLLFGVFNLYHLNPVFENTLIAKLYGTGKVSNLAGAERFVFPWAISADIGNMLYELVVENNVKNSLEVGLAFGLSALFICQAHRHKNYGHHSAIDPCQSLEFESIGIDQIKKAGLDNHFRLLEEKDYEILPLLAREKEKFDFVFIDGLHMHDYVVLDYFYGDLLLEVDGFLAFDDCHAPGVSSAVAYLENNRNYKCLEKYSGDRLRVYQKLSDDNRTINNPSRHVEFFQKAYEIWGVESKLLQRPADKATESSTRSAAIIGMDGVLPKGKTIEEFWQAILNEEVLYDKYSPEYLYTRHRKNGNGKPIVGGMLDSAFEFDPRFFHISYAEAELMDPQLRHLLMSVYRAIEDSGYTTKQMSRNRVGVFIAAEGSDYNELHRRKALEDGYFLNHSGSSLANRLSHYFDFKGPSEVINTMCSSGAFCIYRALELLRSGEIDFAIVGAVKLNFSETTFESLNELNITSKKNMCYSFHRNSEGYIRSEGVVTMVLTSSEKATKANDVIYAHIKEASVNFNGKDGNSMFAPSKNGQKEVIKQCYKKAGVSIADIAYVEAQGMGNEVSDYVEFNAINEACDDLLREERGAEQPGDVECPVISTIKPILGHMECVSALGALLKVVLSFRKRAVYRIPHLQPSDINQKLELEDKRCDLLMANTAIRADRSMFVGLNSFGASGTNVHLLLQEGLPPNPAKEASAGQLGEQLLIVSAKSEKSLFQYIDRIHSFVNKSDREASVADLCYTFQVRREHYEHRAIFYLEEASEENQTQNLTKLLSFYLAKENTSKSIKDNLEDSIHNYKKDRSFDEALTKNEDLFNDGLAWLAGKEIDWKKHHQENGHQKVGGIPTYPFDLKPFKLDIPCENNSTSRKRETRLHPLLHRNTSDITQLSFSTTFDGGEFFLKDHQVQGKKILPGVAYLEMARAAMKNGVPVQSDSYTVELHNIVWIQPLVVTENKQVSTVLFANDLEGHHAAQIEFEIYGRDNEEELVYCQGEAVFSPKSESDSFDLAQLKQQMQQGELKAEEIYKAFAETGINYGPAHQGITAIYLGENQLLAAVKLPEEVEGRNDYQLHPSVMDSALQATIGLTQQSGRPFLPFALDSLRILSACTAEMFAWVRYSPGSRPGDNVIKLDIDLFDQKGNVGVQLRGFSARVLEGEIDSSDKKRPLHANQKSERGLQALLPVWKPIASNTSNRANRFESHQILLLGEDAAHLRWVQESYPNAQFLQLSSSSTLDVIRARLKEYSFDHLLWIAPDGADNGPIIEHQEQGILPVFRIIKALEHANQDLGWTIITHSTQKVREDDRVKPTHAGVVGLISSLAQEYPRWKVRLLDVDSLEAVSASECLSQPFDKPGDVLAFRQGERFHQRFSAMQALPHINPAYKQGGVYVVIGDVEGPGEIWSRFMIEHYQAKMVWIGQNAPHTGIEDQIKALGQLGDPPIYFSADASRGDDLERARRKILETYPKIEGVVYSALAPKNQSIAQLEESKFRAILAEEIARSLTIDEVFGKQDLDFVLFFSSRLPFTKTAGQSGQAAGCTFRDSFAQSLQQKYAYPVKTLSWEYGETLGSAADESHHKHMSRIGPEGAMIAVQSLVSSDVRQMVLVETKHSEALSGPHVAESLTTTLSPFGERHISQSIQKPLSALESDESLRERSVSYFQELVARTLKMNPQEVEPTQPFENYGLDSILIIQLTDKLREVFPDITSTLFFEVQSVDGLVDYFLNSRKDDLIAALSNSSVATVTQQPSSSGNHEVEPEPISPPTRRKYRRRPFQITPFTVPKPFVFDVAIVGLSGRYPRANDIREFWLNLSKGTDCVTEIPRNRWNWEEYYDAARGKAGKIYTKWGGFLDDIDKFDPLFFKIPPKEAKRIDPQERLFLEASYHAIEDAGYTPETLGDPEKVGVFVGVMNSRYTPQPNYFSIANRVSYLFDLQGPSMAVDTACSSSLTAIHLALESIYGGLSECAIAGGVNVIIDPVHYLVLTELNMLTGGRQSRAFGENADGIVDAEGVGAIILKPLKRAEKDRDHIYGVIKGSAINAGGKTNGYTVPNPKAQATLVSKALERSKVRAEQVSYVEAHGTGTALGDPIEIAGLTRAFNETCNDKQFCSIGSVKSNIGHCESAAGIAGLTKVLLQLKHEQLVPSLHSDVTNPEIDFSQTPFKVQRTLERWHRPSREINGVLEGIPRVAGVSSFGAGGANAHVIVEEYRPPTDSKPASTSAPMNTRLIIPLSARTIDQLRQKARHLLDFLQPPEQEQRVDEATSSRPVDLVALAYTLQVGREAMTERLGFIVSSIEGLIEKLQAYVSGEQNIEDTYQGRVTRHNEGVGIINQDDDMKEAIDKWIAHKKLSKLLDLWVKGLDLDWRKLYGKEKPYRMSLPTYPFARERYWSDPADNKHFARTSSGLTTVALHPLLHMNTSDLSHQSYRSIFTGNEFFLKEYEVTNGGSGQKVLPPVACLEMVRAAVEQAVPAQAGASILELHHTVWGEPVIVGENKPVDIALLPPNNALIGYEIYSQDDGEEVVHCQGKASVKNRPAPASLDLTQLKGRLSQSIVPTHQGVISLFEGDNQLLAELRLPDGLESNDRDYVLHPTLMDSALQTAARLIAPDAPFSNELSLPFALDTICIVSACPKEVLAWVRYSENLRSYSSGYVEDDAIKLDIDLCDRQGRVCVQMRGITYHQGLFALTENSTDEPSSPVTSPTASPPLLT